MKRKSNWVFYCMWYRPFLVKHNREQVIPYEAYCAGIREGARRERAKSKRRKP